MGPEPTGLFSALKSHLTQQHRIASESLIRLDGGVKMLKKLRSRCSSAFVAWSNLEDLIQTVDATMKVHPDFDALVAQREEQAKARALFLKKKQLAQQQQQYPPQHVEYIVSIRNIS